MENEALEFIDKQVEESKTEMPSPERKEMDFNMSKGEKVVQNQPDYQGTIAKLNKEHNLSEDKGFKLAKTDDPAYKGVNILHPTGRGMTPNELEYAMQKGSLKGYQELANQKEQAMRKGMFKTEKPTSPTQNKTGNYYKLESPKITNTDAYLTAPVVKALEKGEGRSLENNELRSIVKGIADKNPNMKPKEFEKMLLNYKKPTSQPKSKYDVDLEQIKQENVREARKNGAYRKNYDGLPF